MAKLPSITTITSANNNITTLNANFSALRSAFTNFVSRDGETPNTMTANLDMNSQEILNAAAVRTSLLYIASKLVNSIGNLANWAGTWTTSTAYETYDTVYESTNNKVYRCLVDHTSGTFATDLTAEKWEVYTDMNAVQTNVNITGGAVAGITDLAIDDGGTGASTAGDARTNLGLVIGTDVQAQSALLQDIADEALTAGDLLYYNGTNIVNLGIGTAGQVLKTNSGADAPEWAAESGATNPVGRAKFSPIVEANWTAQNGASPVANAFQSGTETWLLEHDGADGQSWVYTAVDGSADFDVVFAVHAHVSDDSFAGVGMFVADGNDALTCLGPNYNNEFIEQHWTKPGTFGSNVDANAITPKINNYLFGTTDLFYYRITLVGSTVTFYISANGIDWHAVHDGLDTANGMTEIDQVGVYVDSNSVTAGVKTSIRLLGFDSDGPQTQLKAGG